MNSYERVMAAFRHEEADMVPLTEFGVNERVWKALGAESLYDWQLKAGYDLVSVRIKYDRKYTTETEFTDEWGIGYHDNGEATPHAVNNPIKGPEDIDKLILPDPDAPYKFQYLDKVVSDLKGERAISFSTRAFFLWAAELVGMDKLLLYMAVEPEFVDELFDKICENQIAVAKNAIKMGADFVVDTDDYGFNTGPLMSPAMFDEFCAPKIKRFADAIHEAGGKLIKHSDGNINKLLDSIVGANIDALHSIDPTANMDLAAVKAKYGDKITLIGNIDCGNLLTFGNPEEVDEAVKNAIKTAAAGGGYIVASSNTIPMTAKPENVQAIIDATRKYGKYPIAL